MIINALFGDEVTKSKVCHKCNIEQTIDQFRARTRNKQGIITERRNECNTCNKESSKELKELKKTVPSIIQEEHSCKLCLRTKEDLSHLSYKNPFVLDHDHETGKARGWICQDCNTAIARIHDDADTARRIAEYLEAEKRDEYLGSYAELPI